MKATAEAHRLPVLTMLSEYQQTLVGIQSSASDDCVRILTENGKEFGQTRDQVRRLRETLDHEAIGTLKRARLAVEQVVPRLKSHPLYSEVESHEITLCELLNRADFYEWFDSIDVATGEILGVYTQAYIERFDWRRAAYESAIGEIKNRPEWTPLESSNPSIASSLLSPLQGRVGVDEDKEAVQQRKSLGKSSLSEMESDLAAVDGLKSLVIVKLQELSIGSEKKAPVRRVRVSEFFNRPIQTQEELDKALDLIRDSLQKCIDEGAIIILE